MNRERAFELGLYKYIWERDMGVCPHCKKIVETDKLRNRVARFEFEISGFCQSCQDVVYGTRPE